MNILRALRSVTVSNVARVTKMNVLNSGNLLIGDVASTLSEYRRMTAKRPAGLDTESERLFLADLDCINPRHLKSNEKNQVV